jgi:hypothetical protein
MVTEGRNFKSIDAAWDRSSDMGSRWFFYPIHVVTGKRKILAVPDGMGEHWKGRNIETLQSAINELSEEICDWVNGECPCPL